MKSSIKASRYNRIYNQIKDLVRPVSNPYSRMATVIAILHHKMDYYFWTGFYLLDEGNLHVGPYQGPLACLRLKKDTGVCWASINQKAPVIVGNVEEFPGHIACSKISNSEIVIPLKRRSNIVGCLDVDSKELNSFDEIDSEWLEKIVDLVFNLE